MTILFLDDIISELDAHFNSVSSAVVVEFMQLLPTVICENLPPSPANLKEADLMEVLKLYKDDLPSLQSLDVELSLWQTRWRAHDAVLVASLDTAPKCIASC